ncbi:outer membrane protein assembly factor BamB [Azospirillaceae bacterium]
MNSMTNAQNRPFCAWRALLPAIVGGLLLGGCSDWWGDSDKKPLPGERLSILMVDRKLEPDNRISGRPVTIPPPQRLEHWPQPGGTPDHAPGHIELAAAPREVWRSSIGSGSDGTVRLIARPVVAGGRLYALDADTRLTALDAQTGSRLWQVDLRPEAARGDAFGGGVIVGDGVLFVSTGFAEILALSPANGAVQWKKKLNSPARGAPTLANNRVIVTTLDNQTAAFSAQDGTPIWSHTGIIESAGLLGTVSAATDGAVVIVPYSSGELYALRVENGRPLWQDSMAGLRRGGALSGLADIRGLPVIDRGRAFAVSHSGRMIAIDLRSGARVWEQELGGVDMPWVAGEYLFVLSNENEVAALLRDSGHIRWVASLPRYENPQKRQDPIVWAGPTLAGGKLWLTSSTSELVGLAAETGDILVRMRLPDAAYQAPIVANGTLYVLTDNGSIVAFR